MTPSPSPSGPISLSMNALLNDADALSKLDAKITELEAQLEVHRSMRDLIRYNAIPISRLPAEILSEAFMLCRKMDSLTRKSHLVVSGVSRHWRGVALGYPALWSFIDINTEKSPDSPATMQYVQACLVRSKAVPLTINYCGPQTEVLDLCSSQLHRISRLRIQGRRSSRAGDGRLVLSNKWDRPAPFLVHVELRNITLKRNLFGVAPPLRSLSLGSSCSFCSLALLRISTITTLEISQPAARFTPGFFLSVLNRLPVLKSCSVYECLTPRLSLIPPCAPEVHTQLLNLEHLSLIRSSFEAITQVFEFLDIPNATLRIVIQMNDVSLEDFLEWIQWLVAHQEHTWRDTSRISVNCAPMEYTCTDSFSIVIDTASTRQFTFGIESVLEVFDFDPAVYASEYLRLDAVKSLSLYSTTTAGIESFGPLTNLSTLELEDVDEDFIEWAVSSSKEFYPSITELKVDGIIYSGFEDFLQETEEILPI